VDELARLSHREAIDPEGQAKVFAAEEAIGNYARIEDEWLAVSEGTVLHGEAQWV
jgi:hypothetical protein